MPVMLSLAVVLLVARVTAGAPASAGGSFHRSWNDLGGRPHLQADVVVDVVHDDGDIAGAPPRTPPAGAFSTVPEQFFPATLAPGLPAGTLVLGQLVLTGTTPAALTLSAGRVRSALAGALNAQLRLGLPGGPAAAYTAADVALLSAEPVSRPAAAAAAPSTPPPTLLTYAVRMQPGRPGETFCGVLTLPGALVGARLPFAAVGIATVPRAAHILGDDCAPMFSCAPLQAQEPSVCADYVEAVAALNTLAALDAAADAEARALAVLAAAADDTRPRAARPAPAWSPPRGPAPEPEPSALDSRVPAWQPAVALFLVGLDLALVLLVAVGLAVSAPRKPRTTTVVLRDAPLLADV